MLLIASRLAPTSVSLCASTYPGGGVESVCVWNEWMFGCVANGIPADLNEVYGWAVALLACSRKVLILNLVLFMPTHLVAFPPRLVFVPPSPPNSRRCTHSQPTRNSPCGFPG